MTELLPTGLTLTVHGAGDPQRDWRYLWLKYVSGFDAAKHCAQCLIGPYSRVVRRGLQKDTVLALDPPLVFDYGYLCGVAMRGGWAANLHAPFVVSPGDEFSVIASTGACFGIQGARLLDIPPLPPDFDGRPAEFTTCRNWQFGVSAYGLPARLR